MEEYPPQAITTENHKVISLGKVEWMNIRNCTDTHLKIISFCQFGQEHISQDQNTHAYTKRGKRGCEKQLVNVLENVRHLHILAWTEIQHKMTEVVVEKSRRAKIKTFLNCLSPKALETSRRPCNRPFELIDPPA